MVCNYCGKNIESNEVTVNGLNYCNKLCSYLQQKNDETQVEVGESNKSESHGLFLQDLDFHINLNNIGEKKLLLRASFFFGPRLFLDGKKLKPYKKVRFFKRKRYYHVPTEKGNSHEVILNLRPLDAIPGLIINGDEVEIVRKLTWYEYVLIGLPFSLFFYGGMIGATIGSGTVFTNSILLRKIKHKLLRYSMVVANIIVSVILLYEAVILALPYLIEWQFKLSTYASSTNIDSKKDKLTKHIWEASKFSNEANPTPISGTAGATWTGYFFSNGDYYQFLSNGSILKGTWKIDADEKIITVTCSDTNEKLELINVSAEELIIRLNNTTVYFKAVY